MFWRWLLWNPNWTCMWPWIPVTSWHNYPPSLERLKLSSWQLSVWSLKRAGRLITCSRGSVRDFKGSLYHLQPVLFICFQAVFFFWSFRSHTPLAPHHLGKAGVGVLSTHVFIQTVRRFPLKLFPIFSEMPVALVVWDWKDFDPSLTGHVCSRRSAIISQWQRTQGLPLLIHFERFAVSSREVVGSFLFLLTLRGLASTRGDLRAS